jgi:monoamine oxidase
MLFSRKTAVKTHPLNLLKQAFKSTSAALEHNSNDVLSFAEQQAHKSHSRRRFMGNMVKTGAAFGAAQLYQACNPFNKKTQPTVAIVGAGIAGLHAAYVLKQAGITAQIYEASGRVGGRIFSVPDLMEKGYWTEMGGEFIDSGHTDMLNLVQHFNLPKLDRREASELSLTEYAYYFNKTHYQLKDILDALKPVTPQLKKDIASLSSDISYINHSPGDIYLDNLSITEYADKLGLSGWFKSFINNGYTAEYGMEASEQSALNFLTLISPDEHGDFTPYGVSDERYSVIGGNEKLCQALAQQLKPQILVEHTLAAITQNNGSRYKLTFSKGLNKQVDVEADMVLLTVPFPVLRDVDIKLPLPEWKTNAIKKLGFGTNSKIFVGMNDRVWRKQGYAGYTFTDNGLMNGYDGTQMQGGNQGKGVFTIAPGGKTGEQTGLGNFKQMQDNAVNQLDEIYPGAKNAFSGKLQYWNWRAFPLSKCSYMSYKTGQYTTIAGAQFQPVDNLYFAGEHCSIGSQGFMNGGAETGRMAAELIIKKLKSVKA